MSHSQTKAGRAALRAQILLLATSPTGVAARDIEAGIGTAGNRLRDMEKRGELFCLKGSKGEPNRYFVSEKARDSHVRYAAETQARDYRKAVATPAHKAARAWWPADAQPVITSQTKVTIAPTPPRSLRTGTHNQFN